MRGPHVYLVYNAVMKIYASVSHDGGKTWSTYPIVGNTNSKLGWSLPSGGAIAPDGTAYFAWAGFEANGKPSGDVNLFVSRSSTGGTTWTTKVVDVSEAPRPAAAVGGRIGARRWRSPSTMRAPCTSCTTRTTRRTASADVFPSFDGRRRHVVAAPGRLAGAGRGQQPVPGDRRARDRRRPDRMAGRSQRLRPAVTTRAPAGTRTTARPLTEALPGHPR